MQWKIVKWNFFKIANCIKLLYIWFVLEKEGIFSMKLAGNWHQKIDSWLIAGKIFSVLRLEVFMHFFQSIGFRWISQLTRRVCLLKPLSYMGMALGPTVGTANFLNRFDWLTTDQCCRECRFLPRAICHFCVLWPASLNGRCGSFSAFASRRLSHGLYTGYTIVLAGFVMITVLWFMGISYESWR